MNTNGYGARRISQNVAASAPARHQDAPLLQEFALLHPVTVILVGNAHLLDRIESGHGCPCSKIHPAMASLCR
jgi:hypothetical protein